MYCKNIGLDLPLLKLKYSLKNNLKHIKNVYTAEKHQFYSGKSFPVDIELFRKTKDPPK